MRERVASLSCRKCEAAAQSKQSSTDPPMIWRPCRCLLAKRGMGLLRGYGCTRLHGALDRLRFFSVFPSGVDEA